MKTGSTMRINMMLVLAFTAWLWPASIAAQNTKGVFSTWEGFEPDKCASIWLIKRFIDKDTTIRFFPKGELITEGIPFDTPDAKFRRYHNMSTFESLVKHYRVKDPGVLYIGKIIHDMEVNIWERKVFEETRAVQEAIIQIIQTSENRAEIIKKSCEYFDGLQSKIRTDE